MATKKGIDISYFQPNVDYAKVASQIDFVILREGYRLTTDASFFTHVKGFTEANMPIHGIYHFIYAYSKDGTIEEAKNCIANFEKAGLDKTKCFIWADLEYDTIIKAKAQGITYTDQMINENTLAFCEYVASQGYKIGIYLNNDYYNNHYYKETVSKYPLWLADYTGGPDRECLYQQYSESGTINGINGNVDLDYYFGEDVMSDFESDEKAVDVPSAEDILNIMRGWIGLNEQDGSFMQILNLYNSHTPRARGYAIQPNDEWCDCTISACFIRANAVDLIGGTEVGVEEHVKLFKNKGIWVEDGTITPLPGDIIVFAWSKSVQPNDNYSSHIGIVEYVENGIIHTIEGNANEIVQRRTYPIGHGNIRGYARPKYGNGSSIVCITSANNSSSNNYVIPLKNGSQGNEVIQMQKMLIACNYNCGGYGADGEFGNGTEESLKLFQKQHDIKESGIYSINEKRQLESSYSNSQKTEYPKEMFSIKNPKSYIRTGASKNKPIIAKLQVGSKVSVLKSKVNGAGNLWYKVEYQDICGWIVASSLNY